MSHLTIKYRSTKLETLKLPIAVKRKRFLKALVNSGAFLVALLVADRLLGLALRLVDSINSLAVVFLLLVLAIATITYLWFNLKAPGRKIL